MQFHHLLRQRDSLLRQARLANVAFAHQRLALYATRIARAGLGGTVVLRAGDANDGRPWPHLVTEEASQAVLEEHFLEEDVIELADILAFLDDGRQREETRFRLEDLSAHYLPRLKRELAQGGVHLSDVGSTVEDLP